MGLTDKAQELTRTQQTRQSLRDLLNTTGSQQLQYTCWALGLEGPHIMDAARALQQQKIIDIEKAFGKVTLTPKNPKIKECNPAMLATLLKENQSIDLEKAAAKLKTNKDKVLEAARKLEKNDMVKIKKDFTGKETLEADRHMIAKHEILEEIRQKRLTHRVIYTQADLLYDLLAEFEALSMGKSQNITGLSECELLKHINWPNSPFILRADMNPFTPNMLGLRRIEACAEDEIDKLADEYVVGEDPYTVKVLIARLVGETQNTYLIQTPKLGEATKQMINSMAERFRQGLNVELGSRNDPLIYEGARAKIREHAHKIISERLDVVGDDKLILSEQVASQAYGLGEIEPLLHDDHVESISQKGPTNVLVNHKEHGWLKTNIVCDVQKILEPFTAGSLGKDCYSELKLPTGDKLTYARYPVTDSQYSICIYKYRRKPWNILDYLSTQHKVLDLDVAAILWQQISSGQNMVFYGERSSGKTSLMNCLASLLPSTYSIATCERRRQLRLPNALKWNWTSLTSIKQEKDNTIEVGLEDLIDLCVRLRCDKALIENVSSQEQVKALDDAIKSGVNVWVEMYGQSPNQIFQGLINKSMSESDLPNLGLLIECARVKNRAYRVSKVTKASRLKNGRVKLETLVEYERRGDRYHLPYKDIVSEDVEDDMMRRRQVLEWFMKDMRRGADEVTNAVTLYETNPGSLMSKIARES